MKYLALFGVIMFALFAVVQVNDPDLYIWVPFYLFSASMSFLAYKNRFPFPVLVSSAVIYFTFSIVTFPPSIYQWVLDELSNSSLSMKTPSMEEARESLGSLICAVFMAFYSIYYYSISKRVKS